MMKIDGRFLVANFAVKRSGALVRPGRAGGFTLIELMIVVAIIAILAAIAYPAYQRYVYKGRRAEGRGALVNLLQQEEAYITQNGTYLTFSVGATGLPFRTYSNDNVDTTRAAYKLGARACSGTSTNPTDCIQVFGTPNLADPYITELNITSTGIKDCTATDKTLCWP